MSDSDWLLENFLNLISPLVGSIPLRRLRRGDAVWGKLIKFVAFLSEFCAQRLNYLSCLSALARGLSYTVIPIIFVLIFSRQT